MSVLFALELAGLSAVAAGIAIVYWPAGVIAAGVFTFAEALAATFERGTRGNR